MSCVFLERKNISEKKVEMIKLCVPYSVFLCYTNAQSNGYKRLMKLDKAARRYNVP